MTQSHRQQIIALSAGSAERCVLLAEAEIADPIGQSQQVYDSCGQMIERAVIKRIGELVL